MSREDSQFKLRMPAELRNSIEEAAREAKRSLNAEIVARLEETFEIEIVLARVAPGAPVFGTAGLLSDLDDQLAAKNQESLDHAVASASAEITGTLSKLECLPYLASIIALQGAFPDALGDHDRKRLLVVIARTIGSDSKDPAEIMKAISEKLLAETLEAEIGL